MPCSDMWPRCRCPHTLLLMIIPQPPKIPQSCAQIPLQAKSVQPSPEMPSLVWGSADEEACRLERKGDRRNAWQITERWQPEAAWSEAEGWKRCIAYSELEAIQELKAWFSSISTCLGCLTLHDQCSTRLGKWHDPRTSEWRINMQLLAYGKQALKQGS